MDEQRGQTARSEVSRRIGSAVSPGSPCSMRSARHARSGTIIRDLQHPTTMPSRGRLRFCIVSTFYPPYNFGGDGIYAHRLANGLARLGHQVTVLHSPSAYTMLSRQG